MQTMLVFYLVICLFAAFTQELGEFCMQTMLVFYLVIFLFVAFTQEFGEFCLKLNVQDNGNFLIIGTFC